jgi:calpain-7
LLQKYRSQLQSATSKDEALTLAISAAENLMKALKLTSNPDEKKGLKAQCGDIMDAAGRIKNDANWKPIVGPQQARTRNEQIDQWAAEVVSAQSPAPVIANTASQTSLSRHGESSTTAPVDNVSAPSGKTSISTVSLISDSTCVQRSRSLSQPTHDAPVLLIDLQDDRFLSSFEVLPSTPSVNQHSDRPKTEIRASVNKEEYLNTSTPLPPPQIPHIRGNAIKEGASSISPSIAPYSQIRRLSEPVSTRKRSKREDIILLKASMVNGFKCPPWDKSPLPTEFLLQQDAQLFV